MKHNKTVYVFHWTYFILFTWAGKENNGNLDAFHKALFNVYGSQLFMLPYVMRNIRCTTWF